MFTSDTKTVMNPVLERNDVRTETLATASKRMASRAFAWALASVLCLIVSRIYLYFSFGLSSPFMVWFPAIPAVLGALPCAIACRLPDPRETLSRSLRSDAYTAGVITLTLGCFVAGVIAIAEAPSTWTWVFLPAAAACFFIAETTQAK